MQAKGDGHRTNSAGVKSIILTARIVQRTRVDDGGVKRTVIMTPNSPGYEHLYVVWGGKTAGETNKEQKDACARLQKFMEDVEKEQAQQAGEHAGCIKYDLGDLGEKCAARAATCARARGSEG